MNDDADHDADDDAATAALILDATRSVAVVGASDNPARDSHRISVYLKGAGFDVHPVNPNARRVAGLRCVASLGVLAHEGIAIDTVVCFRRSEEIGPIAEAAIAVGAHHLWMQFGVVNQGAAARARAAGMLVVMDRCIMVDHRRLLVARS